MTCKHCGAPIEQWMKKCDYCGCGIEQPAYKSIIDISLDRITCEVVAYADGEPVKGTMNRRVFE